MPRITQDQKHHASLLLASGHTHAEVRQATGPGGKFPLARKPISAGSVVNLSRRMRDEDDVHYRKRRVDANTITFAERIALDGMLRRTGTMYTEELTRTYVKITLTTAVAPASAGSNYTTASVL